jgi:hypothetical protein
MRAALAALLGAALMPAASALACGPRGPQPQPLDLPVAGAPPAVLLLARGWEAGDAAVVLVGGDAFRLGCEDRLAAAVVESGLAVLALAGPDATPGVLAAAFASLHEGFGAGSIAVHWPAADRRLASACGVLAAALRPEGGRVCAAGAGR